MFRGGLIQHAGARFSTGASIGGYVRAIIDAVEISSDIAQLNSHQIVDGVHERFGVVSTSDSGLIGDDKNEQAAVIQFADGSRRKWKHVKTRSVIQIADFLRNGAVAIQKNSGF